MKVNAVPATVHKALKALNTEGIDASRAEALRIVQIRASAAPDAATAAAQNAALQGLLDRGVAGAWYTLRWGPVAEVLSARTTDSAAPEAAFAAHPGLGAGGVTLAVRRQWLSPGVVR